MSLCDCARIVESFNDIRDGETLVCSTPQTKGKAVVFKTDCPKCHGDGKPQYKEYACTCQHCVWGYSICEDSQKVDLCEKVHKLQDELKNKEVQSHQQKCDDCKFWLRTRGLSPGFGNCHRYPKEVQKESFCFCGEFKSKQDVPNLPRVAE